MTAPQPKRPGDFDRRLTDDGLEIESRCKFCGAVIVGSVLKGLAEKERQHIKNCPKSPPSPVVHVA